MRTKTAVIASVVWFVLVIGACIAILVAISDQPGANRRAEKLGGGAGTFCAIGLGVIWAIWGIKRKQTPPKTAPRRKPSRTTD